MPSNTNKHPLAKVKTASHSSSRSPSPTPVATRRTSQRTKATPRSPSPTPVATRRTSQRSPSPQAKVATRRTSQRSPSPQAKVATRRSPSPQAKVATRRRNSSPQAKVATQRRNPSPQAQKDQYSTPFWPPSDYSVPAKIIVKGPNPLPGTLAKHKLFIEELRKILIIEKIIDRDNSLFEKFLAEQQEWNHRFYNLKPHNIVCFIKCDYYQHDKQAPRVFHRNNVPNPFFGNFKFLKLLEKNRMGVKRLDNNILYIHKNRF